MADNTPNFDAMTPEEIMAWMESLAKRQGADSIGFTTAANADKTTIRHSVFSKVPSWLRNRTKKSDESLAGDSETD